MRIAVITDVHANLPALAAALRQIQSLGCDHMVHTGDALGIGPFPAETLALLLDHSDLTCLMGNHDAWFAFGLPQPRPAWLGDAELAHQQWTHAQLSQAWREAVRGWPLAAERCNAGPPLARWALLEVTQANTYRLTLQAAPYNDRPLFRAFEQRVVPARPEIYKFFFQRSQPWGSEP